MRTRSSLMVMILPMLTACAPAHTPAHFINREQINLTSDNKTYHRRRADSVYFYTKSHRPLAPYKVIGEARVSSYNFIGTRRQEKTLHEMMRRLAASVGGDGLINLRQEKNEIKASIIQFQKIMI